MSLKKDFLDHPVNLPVSVDMRSPVLLDPPAHQVLQELRAAPVNK